MAHTLASPARWGQPQTDQRQTGTPRLDLDGTRIAANTGAIALNAVVLLLLLVPIALPPSSPQTLSDPVLTFVVPKIEPPIVVPVVPVVPRPNVQPPRAAPQRIVAPPRDQPVVASEPTDVWVPPADPVDHVDPGNTIEIEPQRVASTQLQAISAPSPSYPAEAIRNGLTGTVELEILVGVDGKPLEVKVVRSSGHRLLDQAARKVVLSRWRFQPAVRDGRAVQALGRVPIVFTLER